MFGDVRQRGLALVDHQIFLLLGTAASIGFIHTVTGPDHYLPFVAMSRIGQWSTRKTLIVTLLCGTAHVLSSVVLGSIGIGLGAAVFAVTNTVEETRGAWAGWLLLGFGLAYTIWGLKRAIRNQPHTHMHVHADGTVHSHGHHHHTEHAHPHVVPYAPVPPESQTQKVDKMTPWVLFTIFVFGPCEPLIPLLMVPAAKHNWAGVWLVTTIFGIITLATMTTIVLIARQATDKLPLEKLGRYSHFAAGLVILGCGAAVKLGL